MGRQFKKNRKKKPVKQPKQEAIILPPVPPAPMPRKALRNVRKILKLLGAILSGIALLLGLIQAYYFFTPNISITPKEALNPASPFSTPFTVQNENGFDLNDISISTIILDAYIKDPSLLLSSPPSGWTGEWPPKAPPGWEGKMPANGANYYCGDEGVPFVFKKLTPKETTTYFAYSPNYLSRNIANITDDDPVISADIRMDVTYRPALLPILRKKSFRFATMKAEDGTLRWMPMSISE